MTLRPFLALLPAAALAAGCGPAKLDLKKTYDVTPGDTQFIDLPPQPKPQRITVEFKSADPVTVGIFNTADINRDAFLPESKARGIERAKTAGTVTADVGPGDATTVTISGAGKATQVELHVTNRK